jgi:iron complex outermembrane receptor protein
MKKLFFFLITCLLISSLSAQQTATVKGTVTDEKDNTPMIGVNVSVIVKGVVTGVSTDDKGTYELKIPLGDYQLSYTYVGYQTRTEPLIITKENDVFVRNIMMTDASKELDIVVVSGNKVEKKLGEQTQSVEVLKGQNITNGAQGIQEAINKVPGVNMIGNTISVRGGSGFSDVTSNRTLVLLDEVPLVSPENGSARWNTMPKEAIEQMEITKGPATVTNGAQAMNALMNVRTIDAEKDSVFNKIYVNYGLYFPFKDPTWTWFWKRDALGKIPPMFGNVAYVGSRRVGDVDIVFDGAYDQNQGYTSYNKDQLARAFVKLRYVPHKHPSLNIGGNVNFCYEKYDDFFIYANYNDTLPKSVSGHTPTYDTQVLVPSDSTFIRNFSFNVNPYINYYDHNDNRHSIKTSYYYVKSDNTSGDSSVAQKLYIDYTFTHKFKKADADISTGTRFSYKNIMSETFGNKHAEYAAWFIQGEKKFAKKLTIKMGFSLEYNKLDTTRVQNDLSFINSMAVRDSANRFKSIVKPVFNIGLNYEVTQGTYLRASFGQGYRFPDIAEEYTLTPRAGVLAVPSPSLLPENGWTSEVGIKQGMKLSRWVFYADLAAYLSRYTNLIEFISVDNISELPPAIQKEILQKYHSYQYGPFEEAQNITNAQIWGVEVSAIGTGAIFGVPLNFLIGYNYMDPKNLDYNPSVPGSHEYLYYRMHHSAKADAQTTYKGFIVGVTCVYIGHILQLDQIANVSKISDWVNSHGTMGDVVLDARFGYNYKNRLTATLIAKNVTNHAYTLRPGFVEAPASLTLQVTYRWGRIFPIAKKTS